MIAVATDLTKDAPIFTADSMEPIDGGMVRFKMGDGTYAEQQPNKPGRFEFVAVPGVYANAQINGQLVTWWTRPQDRPFTYTWVTLPNY